MGLRGRLHSPTVTNRKASQSNPSDPIRSQLLVCFSSKVHDQDVFRQVPPREQGGGKKKKAVDQRPVRVGVGYPPCRGGSAGKLPVYTFF